ncbi:protein phosphatase PrpC [Nitrospira sp. KM1]|uniref:PP2C family protein-serine/threonine phosphatase n=1 Tax=Nitrospira sp. KM1 TaxID=1936990 RepID=UPI0013A7212B|nr:PP2C family serine/threonine-protein phosphatase [Nitrospira sp. KM1]BCA57035.1 protein phosphatase PrpC [Nitrospira sp. KM1]
MTDVWVGAGLTDTGYVRTANQDAFAVLNEHRIWVVADGMGGHPAGDLAANTAVEIVREKVLHALEFTQHLYRAPEQALSNLLVGANQAIWDRGNLQPWNRGMGTTIVLVAITATPSPIAHISHVGDSRAYLLHGNLMNQLTRDHTVVEEYIRNGLLDASAAATHPERHILTRALGIDSTPRPDYVSVPLIPGDVLLLCSDGLTKMLGDDDIAKILSQYRHTPKEACHGLVGEALRRGGVDNVTVVVCTSRPPYPADGH